MRSNHLHTGQRPFHTIGALKKSGETRREKQSHPHRAEALPHNWCAQKIGGRLGVRSNHLHTGQRPFHTTGALKKSGGD